MFLFFNNATIHDSQLEKTRTEVIINNVRRTEMCYFKFFKKVLFFIEKFWKKYCHLENYRILLPMKTQSEVKSTGSVRGWQFVIGSISRIENRRTTIAPRIFLLFSDRKCPATSRPIKSKRLKLRKQKTGLKN